VVQAEVVQEFILHNLKMELVVQQVEQVILLQLVLHKVQVVEMVQRFHVKLIT